jgi:hypothetical protein
LVTLDKRPCEQWVMKGTLRVVLRRGSECANSEVIEDYLEKL